MAQFLNFSSEYERRNALANLSCTFFPALELFGEGRALGRGGETSAWAVMSATLRAARVEHLVVLSDA